jgi:hypothetical protein
LPLNRRILGFEWPSQVTPSERRTLLAGGLGWMLDAFDVMLHSMVLAYLMRDLGMNSRTGGLLGALTLIASADGECSSVLSRTASAGLDRRPFSIFVYSLATGACGRS